MPTIQHTYTSVRCVAYSARFPQKIDLSAAMTGYRTRKACKVIGAATFDLKALRNWQNVLAENDLIAFYIDTGSGRGREWVLWGYVDAVINPTSIAQDRGGAPVLGTYTLQCSDFQKAMDARVFQSLALVGRKDLNIDQDFASTGSLGTGVNTSIFGSPADVLDSLLVTTLGFGQQGIVPDSVPRDDRERQQRVDMLRRSVLRLPVGARVRYPRLTPEDVESPDFAQRVSDALEDARARVKKASGQDLAGVAEGLALLDVIARRTSISAKRTMVDMMSFDFVERECIDGFTVLPPLLPNQGDVNVSLGQLVQENVNAIVNELIFDLRPVAGGAYEAEDGEIFGNTRVGDESYDITDDVLGENGADSVRYVPAVMLREYPFSTVLGIDLRGYKVGTPPDVKKLLFNAGVGPGGAAQAEDLGEVSFGPIFSKSANSGSGRVYYEYPRQLSALEQDTGLPAVKHLDVVLVSNHEIQSDTIARAGSGSANVVAVVDNSYGASLLGLWVGELLPIVTPIGIQRDRLKVEQLATKFLGAVDAKQASADGRSPSGSIASRAIRWGLLWDHWHQHDYEYLSGTITLKKQRADVRVGYRLDVPEWHESYYVEAVEHAGQLVGGAWQGQTVIEVSRGQRNDPLPWYVPPSFSRATAERFGASGNLLLRGGGGNRTATGRLAQFFSRIDSDAVLNPSVGSQVENEIDKPYLGTVLRGDQLPLQYIPVKTWQIVPQNQGDA